MSMIPINTFFGGQRTNPNFNFHPPFPQDFWNNKPFHEDFHFGGTLMNPTFFHQTTSFGMSRSRWEETPEAHVFTADLPATMRVEVKVEAEHGGAVLCVSGEKKMNREEKSDGWYCVESGSGNFLRRFRLPENAVVDRLVTRLENGVLTVTIPKRK